MKNLIIKIFNRQKKKENVVLEGKYERDALVTHARDQFTKLSKKGLSIPVFTL
jgi:hypothetical protein